MKKMCLHDISFHTKSVHVLELFWQKSSLITLDDR